MQTKVFLAAILLLGAVVLLHAAGTWQTANPIKFACFLAISLIGSMLKVALPSIMGTLSINYVFVLIGVTELSLSECVLIGSASVILQCYFKSATRPAPIQIAFNVANVAIAVAACYDVYHWSYLQSQEIGVPLRLVFAAITYFTVNTFPVASIISLTESKSARRTWFECYFWSFPFYLVGAAIAWGFQELAAYRGWQFALLVLPAAGLVYKSYHLYLGRLRDEKVHAEKLAALHLRTIEALAMAIAAKDLTTHDHLQRVKTYAMAIAKELGLSVEETEALRAASLLHDIGKLAVPEHIISKPGRLTPEEFEKMKIHPVVGAEILERVKFPYPVVPIVHAHHEKWDGSGYPLGLKGEQIPVGARILSAVDCLDALASDRQYRKAIPLDEAMAVVVSEAGKSYDPKVVAILEARYKELEVKVRALGPETMGLSKDAKFERGKSPGAGFAETRQSVASEQDKLGFLNSIAAAREEVQTLFELSSDLGNTLSLSEMLAMVQIKIKRLVPHESMVITTVRDDKLTPEFVSGKDHGLFSSLRVPLGQGLSGWVAQSGTPIINGNPAVEPGYLEDPTKITNLRSALAIPLQCGDLTIGVLALYHAEKDAFSRDHLRIVLALGPRLAIALNNAREFSLAKESATIDFLTGLPNSRSLFVHLDSELERCRRQNSRLTVLVCDLDGFKQVNDQFGHLEGDRALQGVATAIQSCCREYDYVSRMGGDEFVILMPDISESALEGKIETLRSAVHAFGIGANRPTLALSIGAVSYPGLARGADEILSEADRLMYGDKRRRKLAQAGDMVQLAHSLRAESVRQTQEPGLIPVSRNTQTD